MKFRSRNEFSRKSPPRDRAELFTSMRTELRCLGIRLHDVGALPLVSDMTAPVPGEKPRRRMVYSGRKPGVIRALSYAQLHALLHLLAVAGADGFHLCPDEMFDLLRRPTDERGGIQDPLDVDAFEGQVLSQPVDKIVRPAVLLDLLRRGQGVLADPLV